MGLISELGFMGLMRFVRLSKSIRLSINRRIIINNNHPKRFMCSKYQSCFADTVSFYHLLRSL